MSTVMYSEEFNSPVPATRPSRTVQLLEGDGGPGSIKQTNFSQGSSFKYLKHGVDELDKEKLTYSYTMIEGKELADKIESISYESKIEVAPDGGSKGTNVSKYTPKPGIAITEEEIKTGKEKVASCLRLQENKIK